MRIEMKRCVTAAVFILTGSILFAGCGMLAEKHENIDQAMQSISQLAYENALTQLEAAEQAGENKELIYRGRGIANMGLADYAAAVECFETALGQSGGSVRDLEYDISYYLAMAEYKSGDIDGAIATYSAVIGMRPKESGAYLLRGTLRLEKGLYDDAVRDFNAAVDRDKENPDLYVKIYESMEKNGYQEEGHDYLDQAMALDSKITDFQKGKLYYCLGDYENARNSLEKARGANEEGVVLYLGRTYEALGDMNYASSLYKSYLEKNPDDVGICNQLGLCQLENGDYEGALASFEKGLEVKESGMRQSLLYNQIVAYEYMADFQKAAVLMENYLNSYPDDDTARREYEFLKTR
ncbi:hypothetical protein D7X88_15680 [bacterium C-53]|nr:hypothetical protein [Lachnospiraceae bacterium]NBI04402.1 hypothetical protein [Lachnospiraceae bacterium]RKJ08297.1 hypothetical protein D7X88_15680 [bacterium C-53]